MVIVAYGDPGLLVDCLRHLGNQIDTAVLIDNSANPAVKHIAETSGYRYLDPGGNVGYAAGVNKGLAEIADGCRDILLLNPDAKISGTDVRKLQRCLRAPGNERVACVSPRIANDGGKPVRVRWPYPSPLQAWLDAVGLGRFPRRSGFLIGPVLLLRAEALEAVGQFDESFFLYAEEADWQRRAARLGWKNRLCADISACHTGGGTSNDSAIREALFHESVERYVRKWWGRGGWAVFRIGVMVGALLRTVTGPRRAAQRDRFLRYFHGPMRAHCSESS